MIAFAEVELVSKDDFDKFETLHFKVENELLALIKSIQSKKRTGEWEEEF